MFIIKYPRIDAEKQFKSAAYALFFILIVTIFLSKTCVAATETLNQAQLKLKKLEKQINLTQNALEKSRGQKRILNQTLLQTEKKISEIVRELYQLKHRLNERKTSIATIEGDVANLNDQLNLQYKLLANHIQAQYKMGQFQPVKMLLNLENPHQFSRFLIYYQYIVASRKKVIDSVLKTQKNLSEQKSALSQQLDKYQRLQEQLTTVQHKLQKEKQHQAALIATLNRDINKKKHSLINYERDKTNLERLLKSLALKKLHHSNLIFGQMRHKLPNPISSRTHHEALNRGILLMAEEGTPVKAVYSGKVVFADWLKGYGLLLIIDHGKGYMTLYAHNQALLKQTGELAQQNEQIATVGHSGGLHQNGLYFEVRHRGKVLSPLDWLA